MRGGRGVFILALAAALLLGVAAAQGCSGARDAKPAPSPTRPPSAEALVALATTDLAVGANRFAFGVLDRSSQPIRAAQATTSFVYLDGEEAVVRAQAAAVFVKWPTGPAGVYVADVTFDQAGRWGAIVQAVGPDGVAVVGQAAFTVEERSSSPGVGEPAPASRNKTAADVTDLAELTSASAPDRDLYQTTIAEAIKSGMPTVVTFATPAFCQTATCGPQVEVVEALKEDYGRRANFIHVEVYDNPHEIEGDLTNARISPLMEEWGLRTEPFTFVLDSQGLVRSKFESFASGEELEPALVSALSP